MHTEHVKLAADGRLILPAALRHALGVRPGDTLVIDCDGDSLLVRPFEAVSPTNSHCRRTLNSG